MKLEELKKMVCEEFGIGDYEQLLKPDKTICRAYARWVIWYAMSEHLKYPKTLIAEISKRTPGTVIHGINMAKDALEIGGNAIFVKCLNEVEKKGVEL